MKFIKWTNKQKNETWIKEDEYGKSRKSYQKLEELEIFSICNLSKQQSLALEDRYVEVIKCSNIILMITKE